MTLEIKVDAVAPTNSVAVSVRRTLRAARYGERTYGGGLYGGDQDAGTVSSAVNASVTATVRTR